jgi:hypothetical protein
VPLGTVTVNVAVVVGPEMPAEFVQNSVYVNVPDVTGVTVLWPDDAKTPVQPEAATALVLPPAVHDVALVEVQLMVLVVRAGMEDAKVSVGAAGVATSGVAVRVTLAAVEGPPVLVQVSV